ncbi:MAG: 50S ribosomal protein L22 [Candidatus Competibacteraceae bacterium]|nr:50S ribosomal protein L22 [Candidatus Competibacteraceae bacterium]
MGSRKRESAEKRKELRKTTYIAKLNNCPSSPRKMRLVADLIRGMDANKALDTLQFTRKEAAKAMEKLLRSAISNFEQKSGLRADESDLYVSSVFVDGGRVLKRVQPAPQGRAHRIRKRSNHVTLIVDTRKAAEQVETVENE